MSDLERHRAQLEQNVEKLRKALRHWQVWDYEHEGLKEELQALGNPASKDELKRIHDTYEADLLTEKELNDLFGSYDKTVSQLINRIDHRVEVASKNIEILEKQVTAAETKLARINIVAQPDLEHEDGEPILDIFEQLDEDGNIVSSRVQEAGTAESDALVAALAKSGIKLNSSTKPASPTAPVSESASVPACEVTKSEPVSSKPSESSAQSKPILKKKGVSFADDTKPPDTGTKSATALKIENILKTAKENEKMAQKPATIPDDESPEDAFLRQEMLKYGKQDVSELGAIVAQLNIEEASVMEDGINKVEYEYDDSYEYHVSEDSEREEDEEDLDVDDENEWGLSYSGVITPEYMQRMKEMQKQLDLTSSSRPNLFSRKSENDTFASEEKAAQRHNISNDIRKKSVKFGQSLDIAPDPTPSKISNRPGQSPLSLNILERNVSSKPKIPDEMDDAILRRELAVEYSRARTSLIQRQGGFKNQESEIQPLDEEEGGPRKVSRFKAARLSKQ